MAPAPPPLSAEYEHGHFDPPKPYCALCEINLDSYNPRWVVATGICVETASCQLTAHVMTQCVNPLRHLATSSTKSSKMSVLIGRAGTESDSVALSRTQCSSGLADFVELKCNR
jgi:hypothetical protein